MSHHILMNSLDKIVANGFREMLENDLGVVVYKKIEHEVNDAYGISMLEAVEDFVKLDLVLRKFFGKHSTSIESKIFKKILSVDKNTKKESTITIKDPKVAKKIFESYGDPAKKAILDILLDEPKSISEAIVQSKLPKTSTYSRVKEMILDGLLTTVGQTSASDGRKVREYATTFDEAAFKVHREGITVNVNIQSRFLKDSFTFNSIIERKQ